MSVTKTQPNTMKIKIYCESCSKKCSGNVLRVQDKYFHIDCFKCSACSISLAQGGFFNKDGKYFCTNDYQSLFGTKCSVCGCYVEGEVVTALGHTYHQKCFVCARCRRPFPPGEKVTYTGKECVCTRCLDVPMIKSKSQEVDESLSKCAGCLCEIQEGQALIALDKQWHVWCFKCVTCKEILRGEYMGKNGQPYCEKDYQSQYGVKCAHCERYITGKVLQAGESHQFHPTCARCTKCGDLFEDGEEMFMQGGAIWHPRCGPGPDARLDGEEFFDPYDKLSPTYYSPCFTRSQSVSPYGSLNYQMSYRSSGYVNHEPDMSRVFTHSYLTAEPSQGYLKRPLEPRAPKSPQFHRPPDGHISRTRGRSLPRHGMQTMVDNLQTSSPRPKSPHMKNEEPIELAHYPNARKPLPNDIPRIERDDFPAPPFFYTDSERQRRRQLSGEYKQNGNNEESKINDENQEPLHDIRLKREEIELSKIETGIGKVFLKTLKEREKLMAWRNENMDPRNSSRAPSAKVELNTRLRYDNPKNASPSRDMDRIKPWGEDEFDRQSFYRNSGGKYNYYSPVNYNVVSSLRNVPKPGYGLRSNSPYRNGHYNGSDSVSPFNKMEKTQSIDFTSKSDISTQFERTDGNQSCLKHSLSGTFRSTPCSDSISGYKQNSYNHHLRRSMPNLHSKDPPKLYPYHLLVTANYRLPPDVDRCHLERHLSNEEFFALFHMTRLEFYRLPEWKRNEFKKRAKLF